MDENLLLRIRVAAHSKDDPAGRLRVLLAELAADARGVDGQDAVVIDRGELAELLRAVAQSPSFGEALRSEGFRPAYGAKLAERKIHPRVPYGLKRYQAE